MVVHVVFDDTASAALAVGLGESPKNILHLEDNLMDGPLGHPLNVGTVERRRQWWAVKAFGQSRKFLVEEWLRNWRVFWRSVTSLQSGDSVVIWVADHPREQVGLRAVLAVLTLEVSVSVVWVTRGGAEVFDSQPIIHRTSQVERDDYKVFLGYRETLTEIQRQKFLENWGQLLQEDGMLRRYVNDWAETVPYDAWDAWILEQAEKIGLRHRPIAVVRLIGECLGRAPYCPDDLFLFWRIRCLVEAGRFVHHGVMEDMRSSTLVLPA